MRLIVERDSEMEAERAVKEGEPMLEGVLMLEKQLGSGMRVFF